MESSHKKSPLERRFRGVFSLVDRGGRMVDGRVDS